MRRDSAPKPIFPEPKQQGYASRRRLYNAVRRYVQGIGDNNEVFLRSSLKDEWTVGSEDGLLASCRKRYFYYFSMDDVWRDIPETITLSYKGEYLLDLTHDNGDDYRFKWWCRLPLRRAVTLLLRALYQEEFHHEAVEEARLKAEEEERQRQCEALAVSLSGLVSEIVKNRKEAE